MKILFQSRVDLFEKRGGDTIQIEETKKELEKLGLTVDINLSLNPDVSSYDIVHVFNLDWVSEPYLQIKNAKKQGKPVVLSPIHHSLKEFERYEKLQRYGLAKLGNFFIPIQSLRDEARNLLKGLIYPKKLKPAIYQLFLGIRRQQKKSLELSDHIIVQTYKEAEDLKQYYKPKDFKWTKVINGVSKKFTRGDALEGKKFVGANEYILCVGRVEPRKNQIKLIEAFRNLHQTDSRFSDLILVFVGGYNTHHPTYISKFKKEIMKDPAILSLGYLDQDYLPHIFAGSTIFAYPSWFETTGLVYLEAVCSGAKSLVASGERSKEYLEDNAVYCDPSSVESIKQSLTEALKPTVKKEFYEHAKKTYTWENCAKQTLKVYKALV